MWMIKENRRKIGNRSNVVLILRSYTGIHFDLQSVIYKLLFSHKKSMHSPVLTRIFIDKVEVRNNFTVKTNSFWTQNKSVFVELKLNMYFFLICLPHLLTN